jgi:hypothetical protein
MSKARPSTSIHLILPQPLVDAARQAAAREANSLSALLRRFIAAGLERERERSLPPDVDREPETAA